MQILQTTDYSRFKLLESNRKIDPAHVRALIASIMTRDLLNLNPIIVNKEGGVIDGQHRLEAAKALNLPIYYQEGQEITDDDLAILNSNSRNWSLQDFLHNQVSRGNPEYISVQRFLEQHPKFPITTALTMLSREPKNMNLFKRGEYKVTNYEEAEAMADQLEKLAYHNEKLAYQSSFTAAYIVSFRIEGFNPAKFLHQISLRPRKLVPCVAQQEYLQLFEELYNYNNKSGTYLHFRVIKTKAKPQANPTKPDISDTVVNNDDEEHQASEPLKEPEKRVVAKSAILKKPEICFETKEINMETSTAIKIDRKTTIYAKPGEDPEVVKANFLKHYTHSRGVVNLD